MRHSTQTMALTRMVLPASICALVWYALFLFSSQHIGNPFAYALLVIAEGIGMMQMLFLWATILYARPLGLTPEEAAVRKALEQGKKPPTVALLVTVVNEPIDVVRETLIAALAVHVAHRTVLCDDGGSDAMKAMCRELGVEYVTRSTNEGKKAGNVNNALRAVDTEFFAILDCDHVPKPDFLLETLPYLIARENLAFVQTPQSFGNKDTFIAGGAAEIQDVFYKHVQTGKNAFNAAFCVGTNVVFRREAVDDIGGMYQLSNSEDIWTALKMHEKGWDSLFNPRVLAVGLAPDAVDAYFRQQFRWSRGSFEILFTHNPLFSRSLTPDQKWQYFATVTHYLCSVSILVFFLLPLLYVYFGIRPLESPGGSIVWAAHFVPYFIAIYGSAAHLMGRVPPWRAFVAAVAPFPAHIMAMLSVATHLDLRWSVTGEIRRATDYVQAVAPHILLLLLSFGAIPLVFVKQLEDGGVVLSVLMAVWLSWNCALLFSVARRAFPEKRRDALPVLETSPSSDLSV